MQNLIAQHSIKCRKTYLKIRNYENNSKGIRSDQNKTFGKLDNYREIFSVGSKGARSDYI